MGFYGRQWDYIVTYWLCSFFVLFSHIIYVSNFLKKWVNKSQMACKPGSVPGGFRGTAIHLGRPLPDASSNRPGQWPGNGPVAPKHYDCPYLVLLQVGFAVPCLLPDTRCALTAPFHPYRQAGASRRSAFCGTFPGVTPAGCYPAPCFHGARTFLSRPKPAAAARPSGLLYLEQKPIKFNGLEKNFPHPPNQAPGLTIGPASNRRRSETALKG